MEKRKNYKIRLTPEAKRDILETKKYILTTFKYRETAESFSNNMKRAISKLSPFSEAYANTGLMIQESSESAISNKNHIIKVFNIILNDPQSYRYVLPPK
ncbi:hypothetical protein C0033_22320 [Clostridium sp. chh4-2]|uniref:hypothetical protein n=1 Tax=Clostridium sp. chh4-2 TaxID=2067550 RepID=UPI000CCF0007|nr:hypothetical protein [Clostridium sp. chh4-2]PNV59832.1 hypothetical protein C0033_22320 [Clostridium sp. chh4-2]